MLLQVYHDGEVTREHRIVARAYLRSNRIFTDVVGTLPLGHWAAGVSFPHVLRLLLLPKTMRYLAALASGREAEAPLFVGTGTRLLQLALLGACRGFELFGLTPLALKLGEPLLRLHRTPRQRR